MKQLYTVFKRPMKKGVMMPLSKLDLENISKAADGKRWFMPNAGMNRHQKRNQASILNKRLVK